jgi:hypothetical protein
LLVNCHNTFFHSHHRTEEEKVAVVHQHDHHHSDHYHGHSNLAFWDWVKQVLGDFEHPDLGEKHFELFLNSYKQIGVDQPSAIVFQPFILTPPYFQFSALDTSQKNKIPIGVLSFSDLPYFDSISYRGPPTFS